MTSGSQVSIFPRMETIPTNTPANVQSESAIVNRVYNLMRSQPGRHWVMADLVRALPDIEQRKIHAALMGMGRSKTHNGVHRVARGVYVYDENRERVWVRSPKNKPTKRVKSTEQVVKPVEVRQTNGSPVNLRPSSTLLMEDSMGNLYMVTPVGSK